MERINELTKRGRNTENERKAIVNTQSASFVALVELVRHMARCAAQHDYDSMLKAARKNEQLVSEWKNKQ